MDKKIVVFNGEEYIRNPKSKYYFKHTTRNSERKHARQLHRAVWEFYNGPIPDGWQVHHIDKNIDNNDISNLECLPSHDHLAMHALENNKDPEHLKKQRENMRKASAAAKLWHFSAEGLAWHKEHAAESIGKVRENRIKKQCGFCGSEFDGMPWSIYCSQSCQEKARRRRIGLKFEPHERCCVFCGAKFIAKNASAKYCGKKCKAAELRRKNKFADTDKASSNSSYISPFGA